MLFEKIKPGQIVCVYSDLTEDELANAPERVRTFFQQLSKSYLERVEEIVGYENEG